MALTKVTGNGLGAVTQDGAATFNESSADVDFRVESNGNANMLFVDGGNNKVGVGISTPDNTLHVHTNSAGTVTANADFDDLVIENNTNMGMSFLSPNDSFIQIGFGDVDDNDIGKILYQHTNNSMQFVTNTAERMRIDTDGKILLGTNSVNGNGGITLAPNADGDTANLVWNKTNASATGAVIFNHSGSTKGSISYTSSATTFATSSDYRLKENVVYDWDATTRLKQLKPARFNFIVDADKTVDGFLAHEAQAIVPESVTGTKDEVDEDGVAVMQCIDNSKLVPLLVKTIQELEARLTAGGL